MFKIYLSKKFIFVIKIIVIKINSKNIYIGFVGIKIF